MDRTETIRILLATLESLGYTVDPISHSRLAYGEKDAAELLSISPRTLFTLRKQGRIRAVRVGSRVVYGRDELIRFLENDQE